MHFVDFFGEGDVGVVSEGGEVSAFNRFDDGAAGLVDVGAVGKAALGEVGEKLSEVKGKLFFVEVPDAEAFDAGRVDDKTAELKRDERGECGGVRPFLGPFNDIADFQIESCEIVDE